MLTDYHCHILPQIDDGSQSVEMSLNMIRTMKEQGVERIFATPHFYAHREENVDSYLEKRNAAFQKLVQADAANREILLGAEIAVEHGLSRLEHLEKLRLGTTEYILLELPYARFAHWLLEEVHAIVCTCRLKPVLAHVHRYLDYYSKSEMEEVLRTDAVFQFNNEAFGNFRERHFVKKLIKDGYPYIFGSDAHNMSDRKPNWNLLLAKAKPEMIAGAEVLL